MGRNPDPTEKLKARGTFRKDRHGDRVDNEFEGQPMPLKRLTGDALKLWKFVVESLPQKVLAEADSLLIQIMCESYANYRKAEKEHNKSGEWKDFCKMQAFAKQVREIASRLGMSPVDRAKLKVSSPGKKSTDPVADMLKGHLSKN